MTLTAITTAVLDLERAGFTREQIVALERLFGFPSGSTVTNAELNAAILRAATKADIAELRAELKAGLAETRAELLKWMFGIAAGQLGLLFAFLRLFPGGHP